MVSADDDLSSSDLSQHLLSSAALSTSVSPPERLGDERTPGPPLCHYSFISHRQSQPLILMT